MLKAILLFIKAHAVATAITTTAVVTTAVATPIAVENYKLDKAVESKLNLLVSSNFKAENNNDIVTENQNTENNQNINASQEIISEDEPLTFRIERVEKKGKDWESVEYKIVPSYDKDISKWTKEEKKAYLDMEKEANRLIVEEHNKKVENEEKNMQDAMIDLQKTMESYSELYKCGVCSFRYNFYTKKYDGQISTIERKEASDGVYNTKFSSGETKEYSREEFRKTIYPQMIEKLKNEKKYYEETYDIDGYNKALSNLNKVYHLSD